MVCAGGAIGRGVAAAVIETPVADQAVLIAGQAAVHGSGDFRLGPGDRLHPDLVDYTVEEAVIDGVAAQGDCGGGVESVGVCGGDVVLLVAVDEDPDHAGRALAGGGNVNPRAGSHRGGRLDGRVGTADPEGEVLVQDRASEITVDTADVSVGQTEPVVEL